MVCSSCYRVKKAVGTRKRQWEPRPSKSSLTTSANAVCSLVLLFSRPPHPRNIKNKKQKKGEKKKRSQFAKTKYRRKSHSFSHLWRCCIYIPVVFIYFDTNKNEHRTARPHAADLQKRWWGSRPLTLSIAILVTFVLSRISPV